VFVLPQAENLFGQESLELIGKPDAWKLARPVWGWSLGEIPGLTPCVPDVLRIIPICVRCLDNNVYGKECFKKSVDRMKGFSYIKLTVREKGSAENLNFFQNTNLEKRQKV